MAYGHSGHLEIYRHRLPAEKSTVVQYEDYRDSNCQLVYYLVSVLWILLKNYLWIIRKGLGKCLIAITIYGFPDNFIFTTFSSSNFFAFYPSFIRIISQIYDNLQMKLLEFAENKLELNYHWIFHY